MGPPGGGKNHISPRALRHFNVICLTTFDGMTMSTIYSTILNWHMKTTCMPENVSTLTKNVVAATLELYQASIAFLLPTPAKSHYTFNLRDFAKVFQGLMMCSNSTVTIKADVVKRLDT